MAAKTTKWDAEDFLTSTRAIAAYLEAAFEDGDPRVIAHALGDIARAKGIGKIAKEAGITRAGLYKALRPDGDPRLSTLLGVTRALGLRITAAPSKRAG